MMRVSKNISFELEILGEAQKNADEYSISLSEYINMAVQEKNKREQGE